MNAAPFDWIETAARLVGWASASAAVLILGAWLMGKVLGKKLGLGWRSALGWLVVLRLLCLVAPESRWSWRNWVATGQWSLVSGHLSVVTEAPATRTAGQPRGDSASSLSSPHQQPTHEHDAVSLEGLTSLPESVASRAPAPGLLWLALLWFVGAVGSFGMAVAKHLVFWRRVRVFSRSLPAGGDAERWLDESRQLLRVRRGVRLRTLDGLGSPVVFGFFRPFILLPAEVAGGLTAGEARHIFLHELAHIRCGDVLANWVLVATRALHWFNPLVWITLRQLVADRELVRDAMALRALPGGDSARREYGHTLLRLAATLSQPRLSPGLASLIHTEKEIKRRIAMIKTPIEPNRRLWPLALAGALGLALVAVTFTAARGQAAAEPSTEATQPDPLAQDAAATAVDPARPSADPGTPPQAGVPTPAVTAGVSSVTPIVDVSGDNQIAVQINLLQMNEERLARLDHEIATMTAANKSQEVDILTLLRGELLKEIYRAKYLPPAGEPSSNSRPSERVAAAVRELGQKKPARVQPDPNTSAGATMNKGLARLAERPVAEVAALRQQIDAMARQMDELKRQLAQSAAPKARIVRDLDLQTKGYKSPLDSINNKRDDELVRLTANHLDSKTAALYASYLADQAKLWQMEQRYGDQHPTLQAMMAKIEGEKKQLEEAVKDLRNALEAELKTAPKDDRWGEREPRGALPSVAPVPPPADTPLPELTPEPKPADPAAKPSVQPAPLGAAPMVVPHTVKKRFTVIGAVIKPGAFWFPEGGPVTLLQAIGMAGGFNNVANSSKVSVKRAGGAAPIVLDAKKMAKEGETAPFLVLPGDVIIVGDSKF